MSLAAIQDVLSGWRGSWTLDLNFGDETSGMANGTILVKELRSPLWQLTAQSVLLKPSELKFWKARLDSLENGIQLFYGWDWSSKYPGAYPKGSWPTGGTFNGLTSEISSIGDDNKSLVLKDLPAGFVGTVGDMISITVGDTLALHRVMEAFTADGGGVTGSFEVRPYIRTGMAVNDAVAVKQPSCIMFVVPGSITPNIDETGWGKITFKGMQLP